MLFSRSTAALALALGFSGSVNAYWRQTCGIIQEGRIDPILAPGVVSTHVHKIAGGSNINVTSDYASMRNSSCTSCEISADKSAYWTPQLYYQHANGDFEEVPNSETVVYYLGRGDNRANIVAFPPGFQMISGDPFKRSFDNETMTYLNGTQQANRVSFNCLSDEPQAQQPYMWDTDCDNGLRAQIQFQSCWDGVNLYLDNSAHVAYMSEIDNGVCPPSHPVQLVHLFYEVLYGVNNIVKDGGQFVFAYGDPTGYGFHGDFLMGWDVDVLNASLTNCANTDNAGEISACASLAPLDSSTYSENCPLYAPYGEPLINETVTGVIGDTLPGCITITYGPEDATSADITCPAGYPEPEIEDFGVQTPTVYLNQTVGEMIGNAGWEYLGCFLDGVNSTRTLDAVELSNSSVSIEVCQSYCLSQGYRFAGVEYADQCFCDSIISTLGGIGNETGCTMACSGNRTEYCGAGDFINIYNYTLSTKTVSAPGAGATPAAAGTYWGCGVDGVNNARTLTGPSYTDSTNMTLESCRAYCDAEGYFFSGTEYSSQCFCGNAISNGGTILASNATCSMLCTGDNAESCGGSDRLSIFNSTTITIPVTVSSVGNYASQGCWVDGSTRALSGSSYTDGTNMTVGNCVGYCSGKGYSYAGLEYASQCFCGNSLMSGSNANITDCDMLCTGSKEEYCGAGDRLNLYYNGTSTSSTSSTVSSTSTTISSSSTASAKSSTSTTTSSSSSRSSPSTSSFTSTTSSPSASITSTSTSSSSSSTKLSTSSTSAPSSSSSATTSSNSSSSSTPSSSSSSSTSSISGAAVNAANKIVVTSSSTASTPAKSSSTTSTSSSSVKISSTSGSSVKSSSITFTTSSSSVRSSSTSSTTSSSSVGSSSTSSTTSSTSVKSSSASPTSSSSVESTSTSSTTTTSAKSSSTSSSTSSVKSSSATSSTSSVKSSSTSSFTSAKTTSSTVAAAAVKVAVKVASSSSSSFSVPSSTKSSSTTSSTTATTSSESVSTSSKTSSTISSKPSSTTSESSSSSTKTSSTSSKYTTLTVYTTEKTTSAKHTYTTTFPISTTVELITSTSTSTSTKATSTSTKATSTSKTLSASANATAKVNARKMRRGFRDIAVIA